MSAQHRFTVLTPTYNRAYVLPRLYESLCAQTFRDFEWVIVDDGSADGTRELVLSWIVQNADRRWFSKSHGFEVQYTWQSNKGKHVAVNAGARLAQGELTAIFDSDDRLLPHTLERLNRLWLDIPNPERFAFLTALCCKDDGSILGSPFPQDVIDVFTPGEGLSLCGADRSGLVRTDVLKRFPYPEIDGERHIVEGVVWNRILCRYGARYINEALKIAGYEPGGISDVGDKRPANPRGASLYYREYTFLPGIPLAQRAKAAINACRWWAVATMRSPLK